MKDNRKTEIKVGITVLSAIIIFVWIFGWAKNISFDSNKKELLIKFNNIAGLEIGDRVTINGIRKGLVSNFKNDENFALVTVELENDVQLKSDANFTILMLDLMGGKKIEISPGTAQIPIDYNKIQTGYFSGDISTAMAMLSSVQNDLVEVIREIKISLNHMNNLIANEDFNKNIKKSFNNLTTLTNNLNKLIIDNQNDINNLLKSSYQLTETANEVIETNKSNFQESIFKLNSFMENSNKLVVEIESIISETKNKENNFGKILYDENFILEITKTLNEVKKLTKLLNEQLLGDGINVDANIF